MAEPTTGNSSGSSRGSGRGRTLALIVFFGAALGVIVLGLLAASILERRAQRPQAMVSFVQTIDEWEADNTKWGVSFPRQYNS